MKKLIIFPLIFTLFVSCKKSDTGSNSNGNVKDGTFIDSRDGQIYTFKQIGSQVWMTQNLNYAAAGSRCYDNDAGLCTVYGRLYDGTTALTAVPAGWHLPSDAEWTILTDFLGGESNAGGKMKATSLWDSPNTGATNSSGFTALPGGFSQGIVGNFVYDYRGFHGTWWSSTEADPGMVWMRYIDAFPFGAVWRKIAPTVLGLSVRCIRN